VRSPLDNRLSGGDSAEPPSRWLLSLLALGGTALLALFILVGFSYVNVPEGWSPRLGPEGDVTRFFPRIWLWKVFALPSDATAPLVFERRAKLLMCGLWLSYGLALAVVFRLGKVERRAALRIVATVTILCNVLLVLMPPVVSGDLFHYALFGRMVSRYGFNPYVTTAARLSEDPLWPYASWNFLSTHYGPSFTYLSAAITWLSRGAVFWTAIGFKTLAAVANLTSCWLIREISARWSDDEGLSAFTLYALNPVALFETAGAGHNEAVVVVFALVGIELAMRNRPWAAVVALLLSADVKTVTAAVALFFAAWFIFQAGSTRDRVRRAAGILGIVAAVLLLLWGPFWAGASIFTTSRTIVARGPELRLAAPGHGASAVRLMLFGVLIVGCTLLATRKSFSHVLSLGALVGFVFLIWIFPWTFPWYALPPLALAVAARRSRANTLLLLLILGYGILYTQQYVGLRPL
jgi:hypothetical protein